MSADPRLVRRALQGAVEAIWEWLDSLGAFQNWITVTEVKMSRKGAQGVDDLYVKLVQRLSKKFREDQRRCEQLRELVSQERFDEANRMFLAFAYRTLDFIVREYNRSVRDEPPRLSELEARDGTLPDFTAPAPQTEAEEAELCERVRAAVRRLSPEEQEVITAKFFLPEPRSNQEIAEYLGCSESTVRAYQSRAIRKLRELLR